MLLRFKTSHLIPRAWLALICLNACCTPALLASPPPPFPKGAPPAAEIDVLAIYQEDPDTKLAAITLQGLVNRGKASRVYCLAFDPAAYPEAFWLDHIKQEGYITTTQSITLEAYFDRYLAAATGLVVYDPAVPASINVATMIGAVESRMVIAPRDLGRFRTALPDVTDLRGRWKSNCAAANWAFDTLWPALNHKILAVYHPTHTGHHLRDYLIANRIFCFWVTGKEYDTAPCADHRAEKAFARKLFKATPPNIPLIGWWGADPDPGLEEYSGVGLAGEYGKLMFANNWQANLSLLSGIPVDIDRALKAFRNRPTAPPPTTPLPDKIYLSFVVMESGDAPAYWAHVQKKVWADPARGSLPIGWTITPALLETTPSIAAWYFQQARAADHFLLPLSGWGYCHPYRNFMGKTPDPEAAWGAFLTTTRYYMEHMGLREMALYTDAWKLFDRKQQDAITRRFTQALPALRGLVLGMGRDEAITISSPHYRLDQAVVSHVFTRWDAQAVGRSAANNTWLIDEIKQHTPETRPAFMVVHPLSWSYYPADLAAVLRGLGEDYIAVSPPALFSLLREHLR